MQPILFTVAETADALRIGRTKIYELLNDGQLQKVKIGRRTGITAASIHELVAGESLPD